MADTTYTSGQTVITADTMNDLNRLHYTIFGDPADLAAVLTALGNEEGTWTGALACGTSGTITLDSSFDTGKYTKKNENEVTVTGYFEVDSVSSPMGSLTLNTLPFAGVTTPERGGYAAVAVYPTGLTGGACIVGQLPGAATGITLAAFAAGTVSDMAATVQAGSTFTISLTYLI